MKKWIWGLFVILGIIVAVGIYQNCYLPEFEIVSTIKTECDDFTSVYLTVDVNRWFYDAEQMEQKVKSFYSTLNVEPDILKIELAKK